MARVLSNIEAEADGPDAYRVHANFMLGELQVQSTQDMHMWIGRVEYKLRRVDGELKMAGKKVVLLNAGGAVPALAFLI
jgi:3-phenylpropionate/cinnamic acid dioxygenase small subunit